MHSFRILFLFLGKINYMNIFLLFSLISKFIFL